MLPRLRIAEALGLRRARLPGLVAFLSRTWDRVEAPRLLAGVGVVGSDEAADAVLAAADADDHLVLHHERRVRDRVAGRRSGDLGLPHLPSGLRVDGNQVGVQRAHEQRLAQDRDAAVVRSAADDAIGIGRVAIDPEHAAGERVERDDIVRALGDVHHPVNDERRGLPVAGHGRLIHPLQLQVPDVGRRDLIEQAVALTPVAARVGQPVLRLGGRVDQTLRRDLTMQRQRQQSDQAGDTHRRRARDLLVIMATALSATADTRADRRSRPS